ncbi:hypothetical protein F5B22DRAFT_632032 [Xylaria bambusicola]|uniref:uncharacterized protein n=1 Tax=Xylaria bambusicola TaxID=326684 RepID=UPI002007607E|nr:uncharacterized protein F5B22DRAFT_632032 [Xylaria bambusicola]KAI0502792.1 hypothetical protein F5B22DRAFT_632032 [Xylaria bambusicola]
MVGVPGRSKGCLTCRRRKKGCDRKRPVCTQCSGAGLECGGYGRERIFLNSTQRTEANAVPVIYRKSSERQLGLGDTDIVLPNKLAQTAYVEKYISIFLDKYFPANRLASSSDWIEVAHELRTSDDAVHFSFLSLGLFAVGESQHAIRSYCYALRKLQAGLSLPSRVQSDSTLAACKLFSLLETYHGTDENPLLQGSKWHSHVDGLRAIIETRSPYLYQTGMSHKLFTEGRYFLLVAAIKDRQRAPLNTPKWRTIPWEKEPKTSTDTIYDMLADMSDILADTDEMRCCDDPIMKANLHTKVLEASLRLGQSLQDWLKEMGGTLKNFDDDEVTTNPHTTSHLSFAHLTLLYWMVHVLLYSNLISIYDPPLSEIPAEINPVPYIRLIANALPYFWRAGAGFCSANLAALPWGMTLQAAYATPHHYTEEILLLERFAMQQNGANTILRFLESLQRDSAEPEFSLVDGKNGLILRAQRWMMASPKRIKGASNNSNTISNYNQGRS